MKKSIQNYLQPYGLLLPALVMMTLSGIIPAGFILFYSVNDSFAGNSFYWVGSQWYKSVLSSPDFWLALLKSLMFSILTLAIQIPLGTYIALRLPSTGVLSSAYLVLLAIPLLAPLILVGYLWKVLAMPNVGLLDVAAGLLNLRYDMNNTVVVWFTLLLMDAWHWTSLVILLVFSGLRSIPIAYYQAARIDGASDWKIFRYIQLPKLSQVLLIAILLRFMDSFMIYTEAYVVTRGGPGVATTFLSHEFVQIATIQFDLGEGGAIAVIYMSIVALISWYLFRALVPKEQAKL